MRTKSSYFATCERDQEGHCKPSGQGGDSPDGRKPKKQTSAVTASLIDRISGDSRLSTEQKRVYGDAVTSATERMPAKALLRIKESSQNTHFYPDSESMLEGIADAALRHVRQDVSEEVRKEARRDIVADFVKKRVGAAFVKGSIYLDGDSISDSEQLRLAEKFGGQKQLLSHIYAHEFSHAIDGPNQELSKTPEFERAWLLEIWTTGDSPKLSLYAAKDQQEGFAEFGRLLYASGIDPKVIAKSFPQTSKFFKEKGLWPK